MAHPFPAFNFSQILICKDPAAPGDREGFPSAERLSIDPELHELGCRSMEDLGGGMPECSGKIWAINFLRPLTAGQADAAIAKVRGFVKGPVFEIGLTPRRYLHIGPLEPGPTPSFSLGRRPVAGWKSDQAWSCGVTAAPVASACGAELLRKRAWAAYAPGWQIEAAGTSLELGKKSKIEIVVLDSGADLQHPALGNWISSLTTTSLEDLSGHGSHVVSSICGQQWGTAPADSVQLADDYHVDFMPAGVLPKYALRLENVASSVPVIGDDGSRTFEVDVVRYLSALLKLASEPTTSDARILNLSLGGPIPSAIERALLTQIAKAKSLVVAAAGNQRAGEGSRQVLYPAGYPECISVGASSRDLHTFGFPAVPWVRSNDGITAERSFVGREAVDVYAPGRNIVGALPVSLLNQSHPFGYKSGTSMATAFATGIFAVRLSRMSNLPSDLCSDAATACKATLPDLAGRGGHMVDVANFIGPLI